MALSCSPPLFLHYHPINCPSLPREAQRQSAHTHTRTPLNSHLHVPLMSHALHSMHNLLHNTAANYHKTVAIYFLFPLEKLVFTMHPFLRFLSSHNILFFYFPIIVVIQKCIQFCVAHSWQVLKGAEDIEE